MSKQQPIAPKVSPMNPLTSKESSLLPTLTEWRMKEEKETKIRENFSANVGLTLIYPKKRGEGLVLGENFAPKFSAMNFQLKFF